MNPTGPTLLLNPPVAGSTDTDCSEVDVKQAQTSGAFDPLSLMLKPVEKTLQRAGTISTIASLFWIGQSAMVALGLTALIAPESAQLQPWVAALIFCALGLSRGALDMFAGRMAFAASDRVICTQRKQLLASEAMRSPADNSAPSSGAIAALMGEKLNAIQPYVVRYWPTRTRVMFVPLAIVLAIAPLSWVAACILLVAGPLIPVFMALVGSAAREASEQHMKEVGSINSLLVERLSALVDIRLLDASIRTVQHFSEAADRLRQQTMCVLKVAFLSSAVLELFSAVGVAMMAVYIGFSLLGELHFGTYAEPLTIAEGIFILMLAPEFFQPLRDLGTAWHDKAGAHAVADELAELHNANRQEILGSGRSEDAEPMAASLEVRGLSYVAHKGHVINFPDFSVPVGGTVALVGGSGSGKSTLLRLLAGLSISSTGTISVGGQHLSDATADRWRSQIGWVSQSPHFVDGSLRDNISMRDNTCDDSIIAEAVTIASATDVIERLPGGMAKHIGETGGGLSGGEARRIVIARAACSRPALILADEPTADLDRETADRVATSLLDMATSGATLVVATHDLDFARRMQQIIRLDATT